MKAGTEKLFGMAADEQAERQRQPATTRFFATVLAYCSSCARRTRSVVRPLVDPFDRKTTWTTAGVLRTLFPCFFNRRNASAQQGEGHAQRSGPAPLASGAAVAPEDAAARSTQGTYNTVGAARQSNSNRQQEHHLLAPPRGPTTAAISSGKRKSCSDFCKWLWSLFLLLCFPLVLVIWTLLWGETNNVLTVRDLSGEVTFIPLTLEFLLFYLAKQVCGVYSVFWLCRSAMVVVRPAESNKRKRELAEQANMMTASTRYHLKTPNNAAPAVTAEDEHPVGSGVDSQGSVRLMSPSSSNSDIDGQAAARTFGASKTAISCPAACALTPLPVLYTIGASCSLATQIGYCVIAFAAAKTTATTAAYSPPPPAVVPGSTFGAEVIFLFCLLFLFSSYFLWLQYVFLRKVLQRGGATASVTDGFQPDGANQGATGGGAAAEFVYLKRDSLMSRAVITILILSAICDLCFFRGVLVSWVSFSHPDLTRPYYGFFADLTRTAATSNGAAQLQEQPTLTRRISSQVLLQQQQEVFWCFCTKAVVVILWCCGFLFAGFLAFLHSAAFLTYLRGAAPGVELQIARDEKLRRSASSGLDTFSSSKPHEYHRDKEEQEEQCGHFQPRDDGSHTQHARPPETGTIARKEDKVLITIEDEERRNPKLLVAVSFFTLTTLYLTMVGLYSPAGTFPLPRGFFNLDFELLVTESHQIRPSVGFSQMYDLCVSFFLRGGLATFFFCSVACGTTACHRSGHGASCVKKYGKSRISIVRKEEERVEVDQGHQHFAAEDGTPRPRLFSSSATDEQQIGAGQPAVRTSPRSANKTPVRREASCLGEQDAALSGDLRHHQAAAPTGAVNNLSLPATLTRQMESVPTAASRSPSGSHMIRRENQTLEQPTTPASAKIINSSRQDDYLDLPHRTVYQEHEAEIFNRPSSCHPVPVTARLQHDHDDLQPISNHTLPFRMVLLVTSFVLLFFRHFFFELIPAFSFHGGHDVWLHLLRHVIALLLYSGQVLFALKYLHLQEQVKALQRRLTILVNRRRRLLCAVDEERERSSSAHNRPEQLSVADSVTTMTPQQTNHNDHVGTSGSKDAGLFTNTSNVMSRRPSLRGSSASVHRDRFVVEQTDHNHLAHSEQEEQNTSLLAARAAEPPDEDGHRTRREEILDGGQAAAAVDSSPSSSSRAPEQVPLPNHFSIGYGDRNINREKDRPRSSSSSPRQDERSSDRRPSMMLPVLAREMNKHPEADTSSSPPRPTPRLRAAPRSSTVTTTFQITQNTSTTPGFGLIATLSFLFADSVCRNTCVAIEDSLAKDPSHLYGNTRCCDYPGFRVQQEGFYNNKAMLKELEKIAVLVENADRNESDPAAFGNKSDGLLQNGPEENAKNEEKKNDLKSGEDAGLPQSVLTKLGRADFIDQTRLWLEQNVCVARRSSRAGANGSYLARSEDGLWDIGDDVRTPSIFTGPVLDSDGGLGGKEKPPDKESSSVFDDADESDALREQDDKTKPQRGLILAPSLQGTKAFDELLGRVKQAFYYDQNPRSLELLFFFICLVLFLG
ncbi:unnamed protein product [Amoebophrya sp. A120]|nr:unnamed protein product [Amoebophrya sp. A120]|eukprot:GSA120T00010687001.1